MNASAKSLFGPNVVFDGHCGLPVWSSHILPRITDNVGKGRDAIWLVSDWKFNNKDYDALQHSFFIDTFGHANNVSRDYMESHHMNFLAHHSLQVIDHVIAAIPSVRLVFWCSYMRTKANKTSSIPTWACYDAIVEKYRDNAIDIDMYTTPGEFNARMIVDNGGHPSAEGYKMLARMVQSLHG